MQTRIVHTRVWKDQWFANLSKDAKYLWLYLLTNDKINISGSFELSDREILFDTSIDTSILEGIKKELEPKAIFYKGYVRILNVEKYNKYRNSPKNETAYIKEICNLSDDIRVGLKIEIDTSIDTSIDTPINQESGIINNKTGIGNQESETEDVDKSLKLRRIREAAFKKMGWSENNKN